jgi:hypothetical protein
VIEDLVEPMWIQIERRTLEHLNTPQKLKAAGFPEKWEKDICSLIYTAGDMCISEKKRKELGL